MMEESRKVSFYNDAVHNYMVLECPPELKDNYQYRMLAANRIKGLLSCSGRTIDSKEYLYYEISSRQSLTDLYDRRPVRSADLDRILRDLVQVEETLTEYLLDTSHLILDPSCVYLDFREQSCSFAYYPGEEQENSQELLFTFLADRVDGRDKQAAALIYRLCMMAEKPGFRIRAQVLADLGMHVGTEEKAAGDSFSGDSFSRDSLSRDFLSRDFLSRDSFSRDSFSGDFFSGDSFSGNPFSGDSFSGNPGKGPESGSGAYGGAERIRTPVYPEHAAGKNRGASPAEPDFPKTNEGAAIAVWPWILAGFLMISGIVLFALDIFLELGEREFLLTRALGGILAAAGLLLLFVQILRRRKRPRGLEQEPEKAMVFTEPEPWETGVFPAVEKKAAGETCLLGPGAGPAAGLYGTGSCRGEQISLAQLPCVIGKMQEYVDKVVDDSSVSRMHARFSLDREGRMTVRDLNSTNGTWLNGERLSPNESRSLQQGDHLRFGRMEYIFR